MKHLVTGGNGYVGSFIIKKLVELNENVISLDINEPTNIIPNVTYLKDSITNEGFINEITKECDFVHHNAALVPLTKNNKEFENVNVNGTINLIRSSINNNIKHFCHMSSSAVFGYAKELPLTNNSRRKPLEIYGKSKKDSEDCVISAMASNPNFSCSIVRPRTILGSERLGIFELLFRWISQGKDIFIIGKKNQPFQFSHINDIVNASVISCIKQKKGIYNVGTPKYSSLTSDLEELICHAGTKSRIRYLPEKFTRKSLEIMDKLGLSPFAPYHYLTYNKPFYFESNYVFEELGFKPHGSNIDLLKESYNSFCSKKVLIKSESKKNSPHKSKLKAKVLDFFCSISSSLP